MKQLLSIILIFAVLVPFLTACTPKKPETPAETEGETDVGELVGEPVYITLDVCCENAEISAMLLLAYSNAPAKLPTPTRESYIFEGWFKKGDYTEPCTEGELFNENTTLYAKWNYVSAEMETMTAPVTVEYITFGGTIKSLPDLACAVESGTAVFHQNPKRENYVFEGWYFDREYKKAAYNMKVTENTRLFAKWRPLYKTEGMTLPIITVSTESGKDILDRKNYEGCTVNVFDSDYTSIVGNGAAQIRGRGNSTWTQFEKKSFRLKFNEKTDLFGMGAEKDYLLISNCFDMSLMRNYTAYTLAGLFGDEVTTECRFVHLYVNGDYRGLYLLTEHTEVGENRVNIGDGTEGGTDVGFLIEFGGEIDPEGKKIFTLKNVPEYSGDGGWLSGKIAKIKSPDKDVCTDEQRDYIADYVNRVHTAILTYDFETFSELCDVESFLNCFIINEVLYPADWGYNFFMYKPAGGKLFIGPLWDYDQGAGNSQHGGYFYDGRAGQTSEEPKKLDGWSAPSTHYWFKALKETPEFFALAREHYIEKYDILHSIPELIYGTYSEITTDIELNFDRWDVLGKPHWRSLPELEAFTTAKEHVDYYVTWLENRMAWLEAEGQFGIN